MGRLGPADRAEAASPSASDRLERGRFVWAADRRSLLLTAVNDVAAGLLSGVQVLVVAVLLSRLLGDDDPADAARATAPWIAAYAGLSAASGVFGAVVRGRADLFEERVGQASTLRLMTVASDVDLLAFESPRFYDRLQRVQSQSQFRPTQVVHSLSQLVSGMAGSVGVLIALAVIQPLLVPIALLWFLPLLVATHRNVWTNYNFVRGQSQLERRRGYIANLLTDRGSAKEVRAFGLRRFLLDRYQSLWQDRERELCTVTRSKTRTIVEAEVSTAVLTAIVTGTLIWLFARGSFTVAEMGAVLNGLWQIQMRFGVITWSAAGLLKAVVLLDDQAELLVMAAAEAERRPTGAAPAGFERITVDDVSFRYPEQATDALTGIDLTIGRGEVVALVGENGSGKTTLAKLLGLLHTPTTGRICWDGIDTADVDADQLRRQVTVVFQDFARYNLTAAENIGLGDVTRLDDRDGIEDAANRAGADQLVNRLPDRYDTVLGRMFEAGAELSVGQWQRIAVSRAFFRDRATPHPRRTDSVARRPSRTRAVRTYPQPVRRPHRPADLAPLLHRPQRRPNLCAPPRAGGGARHPPRADGHRRPLRRAVHPSSPGLHRPAERRAFWPIRPTNLCRVQCKTFDAGPSRPVNKGDGTGRHRDGITVSGLGAHTTRKGGTRSDASEIQDPDHDRRPQKRPDHRSKRRPSGTGLPRSSRHLPPQARPQAHGIIGLSSPRTDHRRARDRRPAQAAHTHPGTARPERRAGCDGRHHRYHRPGDRLRSRRPGLRPTQRHHLPRLPSHRRTRRHPQEGRHLPLFIAPRRRTPAPEASIQQRQHK